MVSLVALTALHWHQLSLWLLSFNLIEMGFVSLVFHQPQSGSNLNQTEGVVQHVL